jgi:hypothetical protein
MLLSAISRGFVMDEMLGISCGHAETKAYIERLLGQLERRRKSGTRQRHALSATKRVGSNRAARLTA